MQRNLTRSRSEAVIDVNWPYCINPGTTENCVTVFGVQTCLPCTPFDPNQIFNPIRPSPAQPTPGACVNEPDYSDPIATKNCHKFRFLPQPCGEEWIEYCKGECGALPCWLEHPWLAFTDTIDGGLAYSVLPLTLAGVAAGMYFLR